MNKKNIGAALSVIAASAAVATAYATTVTDLQNDKHTNSLISEENKEVESSSSFVKSDYTREVKNTKISGQSRNTAKASKEVKENILIEKTAQKLVKPQIIKAEKIAEEKAAKEVVSYDDKDENGVVKYDDSNLDQAIVDNSKASEEVVEYDDSAIEEVEESPAKEVVTYQDNNNDVETKEEAVQAQSTKQEVKAPVLADKFVNTNSLNIRTSKDASNNSNILRTIKAGDKLVGYVDGEWFVTNEGYVNLAYLSNTYPSALVEQIKAEEAKKAEEARKAVEAKKAEEAKALESAQKAQAPVVREAISNAEEAVAVESTQNTPQVNQNAQSAAGIASQYVGSAYVWGSSDPSVGFDCSGLTSYAYRQIGVSLPHSSQAQFNNGYAVESGDLKAGDLVFFSFGGGAIDHVGIVTGSDGTFVHASTPETGVRVDNIFNGSYQRAYRGARRIF